MSTVTIDLPYSVQSRLDALARSMNMSVGQLLTHAAEKILQAEELEAIKERARKRDTRAGFERVMAAVPDVPPIHPDDVIK